MTTDNNDGKNPFVAHQCAKGNDSDGVPYNEYSFAPPPLNEGDRYLRTLVDTRNNTIVHVALVVTNKLECSGNLVAYVTARGGLFIHRVQLVGSDLSFVCAFPDAPHPCKDFSVKETYPHVAKVDKKTLKNEQTVGRLSPFIEPNGVRWEHTRQTNDGAGVPYSEYEITPPDMQPGDSYRRTLIDIRSRTVNHIAVVVRNKQEASGTLVVYVFTARGNFLHRAPASEEVVETELRRTSQAYAEGARDSLTLHILDLGERLYPRKGRSALDALTMKDEHGPLPIHPGFLERTAERLRIEAQPASEGVLFDGDAPLHTPEESKRLSRVAAEALVTWVGDVRSADMEAAKRMCVDVIRPNRHGNDINYGRLAVSRVDGVPFLCDVDALDKMGLPAICISRVPEFNQDIELHITTQGEDGEHRAVAFALEKEDLNQLGLSLSKGRYVAATFMAAHLKIWVNRTVEREYTSPSEFFAIRDLNILEWAKF